MAMTTFGRMVLLPLAAAAMLAATSQSRAEEPCGDAAARLARDNGIAAEPQGAEPKRAPERDAEDDAPASPPITAATRARVATLLGRAQEAAHGNRPDECEQHLRQAQLLLPPG
jgi:hypothetical protein